jgi:hypothetical protein
VSLGFVGDVFEMMTPVDRRLTKVNTVDRIIRVKQLGRKPGASQEIRNRARSKPGRNRGRTEPKRAWVGRPGLTVPAHPGPGLVPPLT